MLIKHRSEVEFDFRAILHTGLTDVAREGNGEEVWRLLGILLTRTEAQVFAAVTGMDRPMPIEGFLLGSIWSAWTGKPHPLLPTAPDQVVPDIDARLADMALEAMNRR